MKYAVAKIGGKQLKITEGETIKIEHQNKIKFDVLVYSDGKDTLIGTPFLDNILIKAKVLGDELSKKVRVMRFKSKSRYKKTKGHRQYMSVVKIEEISKAGDEKKPAKAEIAKAAEKKSIRKTSEKTTPKRAKVKKEKTTA